MLQSYLQAYSAPKAQAAEEGNDRTASHLAAVSTSHILNPKAAGSASQPLNHKAANSGGKFFEEHASHGSGGTALHDSAGIIVTQSVVQQQEHPELRAETDSHPAEAASQPALYALQQPSEDLSEASIQGILKILLLNLYWNPIFEPLFQGLGCSAT